MRCNFLGATLAALVAVSVVAAGCSVSAEGKMVGVWSIDLPASTLPTPPFPVPQDRIRTAVENFRVKLLSDHKLVVTSIHPTEGTWSYQDGKLEWNTDDEPFGKLVDDIKVQVTPDERNIEIDGTTPLGPIHLQLKKTG
jgi:hypothetical protein